jgi:hypothetical protein
VKGTYAFRLSVKDTKGASKYDDVQVNVAETTTTNIIPVANAGADKTITLPTTSIKLYGAGTDKDGSIVSYKWTQYYGTAATMTNATTAALTLSNLKEGKYLFRLTVTDNKGATGYDNMSLVVNPGTTTSNIAPVANAGANKSITLPTNSLTVYGSGSDKDGTIVSYQWTKYSGPAATLTNANTAAVKISNMVAGSYYLRLTVKDDKGKSASDNMLIVVSKGSTTAYNIKPVSNAGPNKVLSASATSVKIYGSASDRDGRIVSYKWTKYSGEPLIMSNSTSPVLTVSGLDEGTYYLKLTVKDDDGAVDTDNMLIVVGDS